MWYTFLHSKRATSNRRCDIDKRLRRMWKLLGILPCPGHRGINNRGEICKSLAWQTREGERAIVVAAVVIRRAFMADRIYYERYKFESLERPARARFFHVWFCQAIIFYVKRRFSNCSFVLRFGIGTRLSGGYMRQSNFKWSKKSRRKNLRICEISNRERKRDPSYLIINKYILIEMYNMI